MQSSAEVIGSYIGNRATTALVSIDFQVGFVDGSLAKVPDAPAALETFLGVADGWRSLGGPVFHVRTYFTPDCGPRGRVPDVAPNYDFVANALAEHSPLSAYCPDLVHPGDILIRKTNLAATLGGDIVEQLRSRGIDRVVIGGLTTPVCVQTTVDGLSMSGFKVLLLEDTCASQPIGSFSAAEAHRAAVERMGYLFADVGKAVDFIAALPVAANG